MDVQQEAKEALFSMMNHSQYSRQEKEKISS